MLPDFSAEIFQAADQHEIAQQVEEPLREIAHQIEKRNLPLGPLEELVAVDAEIHGLRSQRVGAHLAGAHAHGAFESEHEHLAVADAAGPCGIAERSTTASAIVSSTAISSFTLGTYCMVYSAPR